MAELILGRPKVHCIIPDGHAHPDYGNKRFEVLGKFIADLKPDVVVNLGDHFDLPALSAYDKGKASFHGRSYENDIASGLEAHELTWGPIKRLKRKMPHRIVLEGNHEHRLKKALEYDPHLKGSKFGLSFRDFSFENYYNEVIEYEGSTPGVITVDGVSYAHYIVSGISGRALSSVHHGYELTRKQHCSTTVGHSHLFDFHVSRDTRGNTRMGLVAGVFQDYEAPWAGVCNNLWVPGIIVKRDVEAGVYDLEHISLNRLMKEYSK